MKVLKNFELSLVLFQFSRKFGKLCLLINVGHLQTKNMVFFECEFSLRADNWLIFFHFYQELGVLGIYSCVSSLMVMCVLVTLVMTHEGPAKALHDPIGECRKRERKMEGVNDN